MYKFSVVIPIYNVEKYLRKCLDSLINQTLKDIEIICINDGSTDNSLSILTEYAQKDTRIKIFNQENQGQGVARNNGIDIANGEYLVFVDPDDWIELNTLEILYNKFKETAVDIINFNHSYWDESGKLKHRFNFSRFAKKYLKIRLKDNSVYSCNNFKLNNFGDLYLSACNKVYNTFFIKNNDIKFAPTRQAEDNLFAIKSILLAKNILYLDKYFYNYLQRSNSTVNSSSTINFDVFNNIQLIKDFIQEYDLLEKYNKSFNRYKLFLLLSVQKKLSKEFQDIFLNLCKKNLSGIEYSIFQNEIKKTKKTFIEKIFSLKNKKEKGVKYKILTVLNIEFKLNK